MLGLAKLLTDLEYTKLGIALSIVGLLVPLISLSMDVTLIRLEKKSEFTDLHKKQILSTHFYLAAALTLASIILNFVHRKLIPSVVPLCEARTHARAIFANNGYVDF